MKKRMLIMLIALGILFAVIFIYKGFIGYMIKRSIAANQSPIVTVSTMKVAQAPWQPQLKAVGSLRAIKGVNVTTELAGMVQTIFFIPGSTVKEGVKLVQLNADAEIGQLHALEASGELAKITYNRDKAQYKVHAISKQTLDADEQNLKNLRGQIDQQAAIVAKKTIRAPFSGRLGISNINPGQYVNPGDKVVSLQMLNPIYVDFYLPQQSLAQIKIDQPVTMTSDTFPGKKFSGKVTTIDPAVDTTTRNVEVEATMDNKKHELTPGMFTRVEVDTGAPKNYLTLPQTAISFNPYGNIVYLVREAGKDKKNNPILSATQAFVTTGETRGDQITVLKGLKVGDIIVTSGQLKLKNGSRVAINNAIQLANNPAPHVVNEP